MRLRNLLYREWAPIKRDLLGTVDVIAQFSGPAIDAEAPFPDPGLNFASRTMARGGKKFLNSLRQSGRATC